MSPSRLLLLVAATGLNGLLALTSFGQTQTYDPTHPQKVWDLSTSNWNASTAPWTNNNSAIFGTTGVTVDVNAAISVTNMTFDVGGYVISDATNDGTLTIANNGVVTVTNAGDTATISEAIAGTNWSKGGLGTLVINAANTFSGTLTLSAGTLRATTDAAALGAGTLTLAGGTLELANDTALNFGRNTTVSANTRIVSDRLAAGAGQTHALGTLSIGAQTLTVGMGSNVTSGTAGVSFTTVTLTGSATFLTEAGATTTLGVGGVDINMGSNTLTVDGAGNTVMAGKTGPTTSSTGGIVKNGTGTLTFTADPNNIGQLTINAGVVELNHSGSTDFPVLINAGGTLRSLQADKISDSTAMTVNGTLDLRGSDSIGVLTGSGTVTNGAASGSITFTLNGSANGTFSGSIRNSVAGGIVALTKNNTGTATLTGANAYTGTTTVTRGTLILDFSAATAPDTNILYNGTTLGGLTFNAGNNTATAFLTLQGEAGTVETPTVNSQSFGTLTISGGVNTITLVSAANNTMNLTVGNITRTNAALMRFVAPSSGQIFTSASAGFMGGAFTYTSAAGVTSFAAVQGGAVTALANDLVYQTGVDVTALPGYTATSNLLVDATSTGYIQLTPGATTALTTLSFADAASAREIALNGSTTRLQFASSGGLLMSSAANHLTLGSTGAQGVLTAGTTGAAELFLHNLSTTSTLTVNSVIANNAGGGAVAVTLGGPGRTVFTNANTHTGVTTVANGVLQITHGGALGAVGSTSGTTVVAGAALELSGGITTLAEALSLASSGISNGGGLRSTSGVNTYTGAITVGGTARISADLDSTLNLDVASGNAIVGGNNALNFGGAGTIDIKDSFTQGGSSNPGITKDGTGTLILRAANTFTGTGTFNISGGVVRIYDNLALGGTAAGTSINSNGALELTGGLALAEVLTLNNSTGVSNGGAIRNISGNNEITATVTVDNGTGRINSDVGTLTLSNATTAIQGDPSATSSRTITFGGAGNIVVAGGGAKNGTGSNSPLSLTKDGTGLLTMSTASTYTGNTTINGGKMNITGSLGATAVTVAGNGSLGGTGTIGTTNTTTGGTVSVTGGTTAATRGTIDLVDGGIGTLTIQGNTTANGTFLTLGSTTAGASAALNFEFGTAGVDKIAVTNTGRLTLNLGGAAVNLSAITGQTLANGTYDLVTFATGSTFTGAFSLGNVPLVTPGGPAGGYNFVLSTTPTALRLTSTQSTLANAWWTGDAASLSTVWNTNLAGDTNFASNSAGTTDGASIVGSATNVFFTADNAQAANLTTTLGQDIQINSLTFTGGTTPAATNSVSISGNNLTLYAADANGNLAGNGINVQAGSGNHTINSSIFLPTAQTWTVADAGTTLTIGGTITGTNVLTKAGLGNVTLGNATAFAGGWQINSGAVSTGVAAGLGTGTVSLDSAGILNLTLGNITYTLSKLQGTGTVNITTGTGIQTTKIATGAIANHSNSFTGTINVTGSAKFQIENLLGTGATVNVAANASIFSTGALTHTNSLTLAGGDTGESLGQLRLDSGSNWNGTITLTGDISGTGDGFVGSNSGTGTINGVIGESGGSRVLSKAGAGTIALTAANTYTGGTNLLGGTLALGNSAAMGAGTLTVNGASNLQSLLALIDTNKVLNNVVLNANLTINGSNQIEIGGSLTQSGARTLIVGNSAATTLSGSGNAINQVTLNGSVLNLTTDLGLGGSNLINGSGGTINGPGRILLNIASGDIGVSNGGTLTINAVIANGTSNNPDFWNTAGGTGIVVLTADNTFTGAVSIQSLIVSVSKIGNSGVAGNLGTNATINIGTSSSAATLRYTGTGETSNRVVNLAGTAGFGATLDMSGTGTWKFSSALTSGGATSKTLTLTGSTTGVGELGGAIVNNSTTNLTSVSKTGSGTWVLSGTSTYTGTTTVTAGTLQVGLNSVGSIGNSAVTVNGGALAGTGSVGNTVTINNGGVLRPGDNAGAGQGVFSTTGANSNVTMGAAGARIELRAGGNGITNTSGSLFDGGGNLVANYSNTANRVAGANDRVNAGGSVNLIAGGALDFDLNGYTVNWGDGFDLLDWTVALNLNGFSFGDRFRTGGAADNALYDLDLPDITALNADWRWDTSLFATNGVIVVVPEPSKAMLMLLGLACLAARRRRPHGRKS